MIEIALVLALLAPGNQAPRDAPGDPDTTGSLRRDPRALPRARPGRWAAPEAVSAAPESVPPGMLESAIAIRDRDLPRALALLYRVLDSEPEYPPGLYELGVVYFRLQRYGDATIALERFLSVAPAAIGQTRVLGHCYYSLGEYARARDHYERVLAVAPREVEAIRGLALSQLHLGAPESALDLLERLEKIDPAHAEAWTWKAQILFDLERSEEALAAAKRARDLDPCQPRAWFLLGRILLDQGKEDDGLAAQSRYRELSAAAQRAASIESRLEYRPHQVPWLVELVEIHRGIGNIRAAREALARLTEVRPTDVDLRIFALDVLEQMGDGEGAPRAANALREHGREDWRAWRRLERYYARTGQSLERLQAGERFRRLKAQ